ncbi:MAG: hypothetical protein J5I90_07800 [Caldilineales bacterium]|nr:hypothetical protein [Caldilineales bacterium]
MQSTILTSTPKSPFDFHSAATGHGWYQLAPFRYDAESRVLTWPQVLPGGEIIRIALTGSQAHERTPWLRAEVASPQALDQSGRDYVNAIVNWVMATEIDLQPFYRRAAQVSGYETAIDQAQGRFLRSPTLFEDFVKVICTTNTTWAQTKGMVRALIDGWGQEAGGDQGERCFPTAGALAGASEEALRQRGRLGYRAPYVLELARRITSGDLDLDAFRLPDWTTIDLRRALLKIKGIGPYAAASLLTLLGHYDHLAVDSWTRKLVIPRFFTGQEQVSNADIIAFYADWHPYQQLAYWYYDWEGTGETS